MSNNPVIAYIPARGGSKRIHKKNIKNLGGKPIITYPLDLLKQLPWVDFICVSTDDEEIMEISDSAGALTLGLRDKKLSDDFCPFLELLKNDIVRFEKHLNLSNKKYNVLMVLPTAALITKQVLELAKSTFLKNETNFLFSAIKYDISAFWAFYESNNKTTALFPEKLTERSQDLPSTFADAGLFYFLKSEFIKTSEVSWFTDLKGKHFLVEKELAVDVDEPSDWKRLEELFFKKK